MSAEAHDIDWSIFDGDPEDAITRKCGAEFSSRCKFASITTHDQVCGARSAPERFTIG